MKDLIRSGAALLVWALITLLPSQLSEAGIGLGGVAGGNVVGGGPPPPPPTFVFSYPPPATANPINPGEQSVSFNNSFGTFSWSTHQVEDPGVTPHEQYGMWFLTLTPASAQVISAVTLSKSTFINSLANEAVGTISVTMNPSTPAFTGGLSLTGGANTGGFHLVGAGCANGGTCTLETNATGTTSGTYSDVIIVATQASASNSPQSLSPTLVGSNQNLACGPDPAPPQAAAQGFNCETFRWGPAVGTTPADTAAEIDSGQTYAPGFKFYWSNPSTTRRQTLANEYSVQSDGRIITQTATDDGGKFSLNTCGGPPTSNVWTVGQYFNHGYYAEYVGTWTPTSNNQAGFYGVDLFWYTPFAGASCNASGGCIELDNPDAYADDQLVLSWATGGLQPVPNTSDHVRYGDANPQTGSKFGVLVTAGATAWYVNDAPNGSTVFAPFWSPSIVYNAKTCFGTEAVAPWPYTTVSFKVWQTGFNP